MAEKIIIGSDLFGFSLKEKIKEHLEQRGFEVKDVGTLSESEPVDYYEVGYRVGIAVSKKEFERGLVFCGTGMGVNIVANKFPGVYCGLCESIQTAGLCRSINNCNILSIGGMLTTPFRAKKMVDAFLDTKFTDDFPEADPEFLKCAYKEVGLLEQRIMKDAK